MEQQLTSNSILALFDTTKAERKTFVSQVLETVSEGIAHPLKVHLQVKCMEEIIKDILSSKEYKDNILSEAQKHGKSFEFHNGDFSIRETGVSYDWSYCGDAILDELLRSMQELEAKIESRKEFLRTIPSDGLTIVDEETGEVFNVYPPVKRSTTTVAVKLK
jgi:hypothetical protein